MLTLMIQSCASKNLVLIIFYGKYWVFQVNKATLHLAKLKSLSLYSFREKWKSVLKAPTAHLFLSSTHSPSFRFLSRCKESKPK